MDSAIIARNTTINGLEGIHFAGNGIGAFFNEAFLNDLTDIGRGVYSAMITSTEGMTSALAAQWTSPNDTTLSLSYELCENGAAEDAGCTTGSLTVQ